MASFGVWQVAHARSITLLGVRARLGPEVRFLSRHAKTGYQYWSLSATEVTVGDKVRSRVTTLVDRRAGYRRQKAGLFETHRRDLLNLERAEKDKAQLDQFQAPTALTCTESAVLTGVRPRLVPKDKGSSHFASQCVLRDGSGTAYAKVLMRVVNKATEISLAIPEHGVLIKSVTVPHLELRLRHRGVVSRPIERLHRAWVAFPTDSSRQFFVLIWDFLTPDLPDLEQQQILTIIVKDPGSQKWRGHSF